MGIKSFVKRHNSLYKPAAWTRDSIRRGVRQTRVYITAVRRGTLFSNRASNVFSRSWGNQKYLEFEAAIPHCEHDANLTKFLEESSIEYCTGRWTIYVPPQDRINRIFPFLESAYPDHVGLKILKSFEPPETAKYVTQKYTKHPPHPSWDMDIPQLVRVANYLYRHELGPRVYDVVCIKNETQRFTGFVIQHLDSEGLRDGDCDRFLEGLKEVLSRNDIIPAIQSWQTHVDFAAPDCNGNLIRDARDGKLYYVDFQTFMFRNEARYLKKLVSEHRKTFHFGTEAALLGGRFLYQSIPGINQGRRDTGRRWEIIKELLGKAGADIHNAVVFDVCCNAGMMLYHSLVEGAYWGVGWDLPEVAEVARTLQSALGMTRVEFVGRQISGDTDFLSDLPSHITSRSNGILFYLAAHRHIGFPSGIARLPWTTMVYEGHDHEDFDRTKEILGGVTWLGDAKIEAITTNEAELGELRTLAVLCRK